LKPVSHENYIPRIPSLHGPWKLATWPFFIAWNRSHEALHENKLPWKTSWLLSHATKECEVANLHGQASDAYAYVRMVQSILFSWKTLWNLCHTFWPFFIAWNRSHEALHENKLPYICSMYDTGFKVLSMKKTTLHHSSISKNIRSLPMKISYLQWRKFR
jgi:hypothetical protein